MSNFRNRVSVEVKHKSLAKEWIVGGCRGSRSVRYEKEERTDLGKLSFLFAELHLMQLEVKTTLGQELFVGADLANFAFIEHDDLVGLPDGGKTMGDDDRAATGDQLVDGFLDELFGFGVDGGSGFVQDQDRGIV